MQRDETWKNLLMAAGAISIGYLVWKLYRNLRSPSLPLTPVAAPVASAALPPGTYKNAEEWDIEWNEDGLPKKVTIHRNAQRT